jgi:hypothetical protein
VVVVAGARQQNARRVGSTSLSQETTCFVSPEYFAEQDPFADFVVHEAAHVFHNCKRRTLGLRETRTKEWLLQIDFCERETFAYSCEAFACLLRRARSAADRRGLADEYARSVRVPDERVDSVEVADIVREASESRNGWKVCRAAPRRHRALWRSPLWTNSRQAPPRFRFRPVDETGLASVRE